MFLGMSQRLLPWLAGLTIAILSIVVLAMQVYPIYKEINDPKPITAPTTNLTNKPQNNASNQALRNAATFSLFGKYNTEAPAQQKVQNIPKTKLRLVLTGVSATADQSNAYALIEDPKRVTDSYRVGDTLPGNATLHEVHHDRIILDRSGKLETLFFPETDSSTRLLASTMNSNDDDEPVQGADVSFVNNYGESPVNIPQGATRISPAEKRNIRDKLSALRARLKNQ